MKRLCQQCGVVLCTGYNPQRQFCTPCSEARAKTNLKNKKYFCKSCGCERPRSKTRFCAPCSALVDGRGGAHAHVARAKQQGLIPDLRVVYIKCTDCDNRAEQYDHRDYKYPLLVYPVCRGCNIRRGTAPGFPVDPIQEAA